MQPLEGTYAGVFPGIPEQIATARGQIRQFMKDSRPLMTRC